MEEGNKYDSGKPRVGEMLQDFALPLLEVTKAWEYGASKYEKRNWRKVKDGKERYTNALLRHLLAEEERLVDDESLLLHATHVAWNALARLWFILQEQKLKPVDYIKDFFDCNAVDCASLPSEDSRCREMINNAYIDKKIERLD